MLLPSFFQLAAKSVAQQIHNEKIPLDFHLDTKSSNTVVKELLELNPENIEKLKTYKKQLSRLRELDLRKCKIDQEGISNLKNFDLISLEFGPLLHLTPDFPGPTNSYGIDIVNLLKRAVNTNTQKMMVHFGYEEALMSGWEEKISKLLPSLQSLKIIGTKFCRQNQLTNLCNSFSNLRTLDISYAGDLSAINGIKNLKHLQKFVMRGFELEIIDGFKELSELKNLRVLDVSDYVQYPEIDNGVMKSLLTAEVRIENLEFLDCSLTSFQDHELKAFVERHPSLKTVVAISTECNNSYIPTIDLHNYNSPDSTIKSLEYAIRNDRDELAEDCIRFIAEKLNTNHDQLNDSEIKGFVNALCYVLREAKDERTKYEAIQCFATSSFFETERFFETFLLEIPGIVELLFKSWEHVKRSEIRRKTILSWILTVFERMVNFLRMGKILQDRLLYLIVEKTIELSCQHPDNIRKAASILIEAHRYMNLDLYTTLFTDMKMVEGLFEFAHYSIELDTPSYQQIMELFVRYFYQASEETLTYLVLNCEAVEKCHEQVMQISQLPIKGAQKHLSNIVVRLMCVIDTNGFRNPYEKTRGLIFCSTLSLLLAHNLIENQEDVNTKIKDFNDSWGRSSHLDCQKLTVKALNTVFTSEYSTDESIRFGLILMSTFIDPKFCLSKGYWKWIRRTLEGIQNNKKSTKKTRESASKILHAMSKDIRWSSYYY
ncbi:hypothetical protein B9Z55_004925 [Caenorhabditis nigoni]|uniref:Uncharacterized protein n=1 Tax=Caenorhabditis nigoni TaxID=1611254 RepID=A0A2G5UYK1_9PELO|nr:hypothetical protein B9Z55_004925 [Caenorhabditis nigoni]